MRFDLILVDGSNALHRAHHTAKGLTTTVDGEEVSIGATYQFLRIILGAVEKHGKSDCKLMIAWEGGPDLFRHSMWEQYKRRERNPDIERQRSLLQERILPTFGWSQARSPEWEADDVLATIARFGEETGRKIGILSGDHDMHQVVTDNVHVINPTNRPDLDDGITWRPRDVKRRWGVEALLIPDVKALCGDPGDGVPGAPGIGDKWAKGLVATFGDLNGVIKAANSLGDKFGSADIGFSKKKAETISENADKLYIFKSICLVNRHCSLQWLKREKHGKSSEILREFRFSSLLAPTTLQLIKRLGE